MTTGIIVSGRGDLDALFKARTSTAAANTGFKSNGGVDLAQRFEPRAATTAIANTNYKAGATDLAQIFMDISASGGSASLNMTAGWDVPSDWRGFDAIPGNPAIGSVTSNVFNSMFLNSLVWINASGVFVVGLLKALPAPADVDTVWQRIEITGIFSDSGGLSVTRTRLRSARLSTTTATSGANGTRTWSFDTAATMFISGNTYAVTLFYS